MDNPFFSLMENAMIPTQQGIQPGPATMPQGAPAPQAAPQGGGTLESILRAALPALAGFYAGRQGQLGTFAGAMAESQGNLDQQQFRQQQLDMQQQRIAQDDLRQAQALARDDRNYQERHSEMLSEAAGRIGAESERQRKIAEAERVRAIQGSLESAAFNPDLNEKLRTLGPDHFVIDVPGIGKMNLAEALQAGADVPKNLGDAPPAPPREPLVTGLGPDGKTPTRVKDAPGVRVYEKPDKPEKPTKTATRAFTWKDEDPDSPTFGQSFRIVEDDQGTELSRRPIAAPPKPAASHAPSSGGAMSVGRFTVRVK